MVRSALRDRFHPIPAFASWNDWWIATQLLRETDIVAIPACVNIYREHGANMNLGGDEERAVSLLRAELPFRRWLLSHTAPPLVGVADLVRALAVLDWAIARISAFDGQPPELPADGARAQATLHTACEALRAGEIEAGIVALVGAISDAPRWAEPRSLLAATLAILRERPPVLQV
jgi:hypothetical protein